MISFMIAVLILVFGLLWMLTLGLGFLMWVFDTPLAFIMVTIGLIAFVVWIYKDENESPVSSVVEDESEQERT